MNKNHLLELIDAEIGRLQEARRLLGGSSDVSRNGHRGFSYGGARKRRRMSAEAKRRISIAQKKRWAARKKAAS